MKTIFIFENDELCNVTYLHTNSPRLLFARKWDHQRPLPFRLGVWGWICKGLYAWPPRVQAATAEDLTNTTTPELVCLQMIYNKKPIRVISGVKIVFCELIMGLYVWRAKILVILILELFNGFHIFINCKQSITKSPSTQMRSLLRASQRLSYGHRLFYKSLILNVKKRKTDKLLMLANFLFSPNSRGRMSFPRYASVTDETLSVMYT